MRWQGQEILKEFEGISFDAKVVKLVHILDERKINHEWKRSSHGRWTEYYVGDDVVLALVLYPDKKTYIPVVVERRFYDAYLSDGNGSLCINGRKTNDFRVRISRHGFFTNIPLHRAVMKSMQQDIKDFCVDHKYLCVWINTLDGLRVCTVKQNNNNRSNCKNVDASSEFAYDAGKDFTYTWYGYVLHKMLGICSWEELEEYNREYNNTYARGNKIGREV